MKSNVNGDFKLQFLIDTASQEEAVTLFYSKVSEGFHHLFDCAGMTCGPGTDEHGIAYLPARQTITLVHMQLARPLEVYESSSVSFSGKVSFPMINTPYTPPRGGAIPTGWPWGHHLDAQCYLGDVEVCLIDFTSNEVMVCTKTEKDGSYLLNAPVGMSVYARVTSSRTTQEHFVRAASSKVDDVAIRSGFVTARAVGTSNGAETAEADQYTMGRDKMKTDETGENFDSDTEFTPNSEEELFFIDPREPDIWRGMDYEDHTFRVMKIGAHGTKCKLPLGDTALFTFRFTESIGCTFEYTLPTDTFTDATIVVPAHPFDIAFSAVTPSYSAVTDASNHGYLFRMGRRTQRIDLREPAQEKATSEEEKKAEGELEQGKENNPTPSEHSVIFEYRPAPTLEFHTNSSEFEEDPSLAYPGCKSFRLHEDGEESTAVPIPPQYRLTAGSAVSIRVTAAETIQNDQDDELGECTDLNGEVHLHSRLGLTTEEAADLDLDSETAEHKLVKRLLDKSIAVTADADIEEMRTCMGVVPDGDHPGRNCLLPLQLTGLTIVRDLLDSPHCGGKKHDSGFSPVGGSADTDEQRLEECQVAWKPLLQRAADYKVWRSFAWDEAQSDKLARQSMNRLERAVWTQLGVKPELWTGDWTTGGEFLESIMTVVPLWADMSAETVSAVEKTLRYSEETFGRLWALRQRMVSMDDTVELALPLSWSQLTTAETGHLSVLGWSKSSWDETEPHESSIPGSSVLSFAELGCAQRSAARSLGFFWHTWPVPGSAITEEADSVGLEDSDCAAIPPHRTNDGTTVWEMDVATGVATGCFYDAATMQVVTQRPTPTLSPGDGPTFPRFHSLCEHTTHDGAEVTQTLRVGLPGRSAALSVRTLTASIESTGHPLVVNTLAVVVTGERFVTDKETVPYPQGSPLLVLHDPPGGASQSTFTNVRVETTMTTNGQHVKHGFFGETGATVGFEAELMKQSMCVGLGYMQCMELSPDAVALKANINVGMDANLNFESGSDKSRLMPKLAFDVEFSYSTSDDSGSAGPMADMFLMPSGIIQLTKVHVVSVDNVGNNATCSIRGHMDTSMAIKWNLAGFHFLTAADIEARVIPQLSRAMFRQECAHKSTKARVSTQERVQACCLRYNATRWHLLPSCTSYYFESVSLKV